MAKGVNKTDKKVKETYTKHSTATTKNDELKILENHGGYQNGTRTL